MSPRRIVGRGAPPPNFDALDDDDDQPQGSSRPAQVRCCRQTIRVMAVRWGHRSSIRIVPPASRHIPIAAAGVLRSRSACRFRGSGRDASARGRWWAWRRQRRRSHAIRRAPQRWPRCLPEDQPEADAPKELPPHLKRQEVYYATKEPAGTIIVDTPNTHLYLVLGGNRAMRYGVRVGRDGFTWAGVQKITRKAEWPDWHPPAEMIERQPYLPRFMAGGDGNPLGARAMYLGNTVYRIHGTNQPSTIGQFVSSGCVGMLNEDVSDLFERVKVGTRVVVLPGGKPPAVASAQEPTSLAAPGGQQSYPPTNYVPPQGAQAAPGQVQVRCRSIAAMGAATPPRAAAAAAGDDPLRLQSRFCVLIAGRLPGRFQF